MKLNQKLVKQLRNGEISAENDGTLGQLQEVFKAAFPNSVIPTGSFRYYSWSEINTNAWRAYSFKDKGKPTFKISDFYQPELFTGWAKDDNHPKWMVYFKDDIALFGFNDGDDYSWVTGAHTYIYNYSKSKENRPATNEEIETTLTKEAKRRGYKGGDTIKGIHGTSHIRHEIISFTYDPEDDRLLTNEGCIVYEKGQWAEIVEKPQPKKSTSLNYLIDGVEYSFNYQELKARYEDISQYSDEQFMEELPKIAHLACIISTLKGLGIQATIGDKGIIHEIIHLMTEPNEPTNDLSEIREKFNCLIKLV